MIKSMTAFASAEKREEKLTINVEIRSYNNRYLDTSLRIPQGYLSLEDKIKEIILEKVSRGRIELKLKIKDDSEDAWAFEVDEPRARAYYDALRRLKNMFGMEADISPEFLAGVGGIIKSVETEKNMDARWHVIRDCITKAMDNLNNMREKEGNFIAQDFSDRLDYIEKGLGQIEIEADSLPVHYQDRLRERVFLLTRGIVELDPERIEQEAAFLADRSDISEEIVRAKSHFIQFRDVINSDEPSGRKLNFLLQELNREFNTMGSKAGSTNVSHVIVNIKAELEKIREQVQNVE